MRNIIIFENFIKTNIIFENLIKFFIMNESFTILSSLLVFEIPLTPPNKD